MLIVRKSADRFFTQIAADSADRKIHSCKFQSGIRRLLAEYCNLFCVAVMSLYKLHRLHKHTARTAARVINFALIRLDKFGNQVDDTFRRIEFALALSFLQCKVGKEILVHPAHNVLLVVFCEFDFVDLIQKRSEFCRVKPKARIVIIRQRAFERGIVLFDRVKGRVNFERDVALFRLLHDIRPTRFGSKIEHVFHRVEIDHFHIRAFPLVDEFLLALFKLIARVLQKDKAQNDVFVFRRLYIASEFICRLPKSRFH